MPLIYKPYQSTLETKEKKRLFYPRVVLTGNVTTDQIAKEIAEYSSLSKGDAKNTIDNLVTVMSRHLQSSESVTLDGFGTFRLAMRASGNGVETADEVSASQAVITVLFTPATTRNADRTTATRSMVTGVRCVRADRLSVPGTDEELPPSEDEADGDDDQESPDPIV